MRTKKIKPTRRERRYLLFHNGCMHGIRHSELVAVRTTPNRSLIRNSVAVFTVSKTAGFLGLAALLTVLVLFLAGCQLPGVQQGGAATSLFTRGGHTNFASLHQSDNPNEPSRQTVQSEQTVEYVLPPGAAVSLMGRQPGVDGHPGASRGGSMHGPLAYLRESMPVKWMIKDRSDTSIGAAQHDTAREWSSKAAGMQPVMWTGIALMTLVAGVLIYFGWWTKAALAVGTGAGMIVLAQTVPEYGTVILFGGMGVFGLVALLILYAYHKGRLDKDHNGIPDFLQRDSVVPY